MYYTNLVVFFVDNYPFLIYTLGECFTCNPRGKPTHVYFRCIMESETNFAHIEQKLLAFVFGMQTLKKDTYGKHFKIEYEHFR